MTCRFLEIASVKEKLKGVDIKDSLVQVNASLEQTTSAEVHAGDELHTLIDASQKLQRCAVSPSHWDDSQAEMPCILRL